MLIKTHCITKINKRKKKEKRRRLKQDTVNDTLDLFFYFVVCCRNTMIYSTCHGVFQEMTENSYDLFSIRTFFFFLNHTYIYRSHKHSFCFRQKALLFACLLGVIVVLRLWIWRTPHSHSNFKPWFPAPSLQTLPQLFMLFKGAQCHIWLHYLRGTDNWLWYLRGTPYLHPSVYWNHREVSCCQCHP